MMRRLWMLAACISPLALSATGDAQQSASSVWRVRADGPPSDSARVEPMAPGWHFTTGPGAIYYSPDYTASGRFTLESEMFLFPGTSQEGYGFLVGASSLLGGSPSYLAFLVRRDGSAAVERVSDGRREELIAWSVNPAVKLSANNDSTARNVLRLTVERDSITFDANGERVTAVARGQLPTDGVFGVRVGSGLNLHISSLDVTARLAPIPAARR